MIWISQQINDLILISDEASKILRMTSTSYVSLLSTSLLLVVNLSTLTQGWRWPSASQTVQSFSDLLGIKDRSPQTFKGSRQQQNGGSTKHLWSSQGANPGSVGHVRTRGLDVISPHSPYGLIHKVINIKHLQRMSFSGALGQWEKGKISSTHSLGSAAKWGCWSCKLPTTSSLFVPNWFPSTGLAFRRITPGFERRKVLAERLMWITQGFFV